VNTRTITISIPHKLTQDEARRRIQSGIADAQKQFVGKLTRIEESWADNHLEFKFAALGQPITGRLDVLPSSINVSIDLPWLLAMLADKIKPEVEQRGRKLLE
jgi:hypothetical protein